MFVSTKELLINMYKLYKKLHCFSLTPLYISKFKHSISYRIIMARLFHQYVLSAENLHL